MLQDLIKIGLSDKEAKVYLALMELGPSTVTEISKKARVTRTNGYHLLNSLITKGLISSNEEKSKMIFAAEDPERLLSMLETQLKQIESNIQHAKKILPEFKAIYKNPAGKLKVKFYEGVEGVISAYEDTLTSKSTILAFCSVEYGHSFMPGYIPEYYGRRAGRGIHLDSIVAYTKESFRTKELDEKHLRESKIVPLKYQISIEINIYDDKVAIMSLKEKFAAIIESKDVAEAFRHLYELAYERAAQYDEKIGKSYDPKVEEQMRKEIEKEKEKEK
ncbi:hypothetical protein HZA39_02110 [Candidatus Peregrinibacteria bacterium]|nr:hypothetical protein [Candidatus Peregrinibacteria bacterium]